MIGGLLKLITGLGSAIPAMNTARWKAVEAVAKSRILNALTFFFGLIAAAIAINDQFIGYYPPGIIIDLALNSRTLIYTAFLTLIGAKGGTAALTVKQRHRVANAIAAKHEAQTTAQAEAEAKATATALATETMLVLKRTRPPGAEPTHGEMFYRHNGELLFLCYTLELPWRNNRKRVSCIPPGLYTLDRPATHGAEVATRLKYKLYILQVPNRSGIAIHGSDSDRPALKQITGCCLVSVDPYIKKGKPIKRWHSIAGSSAQAVNAILKVAIEHRITKIEIQE